VDVPETRYARSGELAIAYQVHGSGEHDLLFSVSFGHLDAAWRFPEALRLFKRLGRFARVIRFDRRDSGLSDPIRDDLTIEAHVADALSVIDAVGAKRPVLIGASEAGRALAALAATRPERVAGMIAISSTARGTFAISPDIDAALEQRLIDLDYPGAAAALWSPQWAADPVRNERLVRYTQNALTPRQAERFRRMSLTSDISAVLPLVQAPTLVLHPRDCAYRPEPVREFASLIPGAIFREIPGDAMLPYALDVELLADIIEEFVTGTAPAPPSNRVLATVLFTDLVGSTERASQAGDRAWADLLERHFAATRAIVTAHGGQTIKTTGDGVLASFAGPAQGVRCADRLITEAGDLGLELRAGLHTGEVERTGDDVAGVAVHLAARIMALAGAGEILVSRTVRDLVIGSELTFTDRGEHQLKGMPDRWAIYTAAT
jgi:class 3 adenylate cyclase